MYFQFDCLVMKWGVVHWIYITNDVEAHQLVFSRKYHETVLCILHDDYGHQELDWTFGSSEREIFLETMNQDITDYITNCHQCHVTKGHFTGLQIKQGFPSLDLSFCYIINL